MTVWKKLSQINKNKFHATGDVRFAILSLAADAKLPSRNKFRLYPTTVEDFSGAVAEIVESGGDIKDALQRELNKNVASFLALHLKSARPDLEVFNSMLPKNPLSGLIPQVLPYDNESLERLKEHLAAGKFPTPEVREIIDEVASDTGALKNALTFVISLAFVSTIKQHLINNPILTVLPNAIIKSAAISKADVSRYKAPRLKDLIDALKIVHGKLLLEYNQAALADFMRGSPDFQTLFPAGVPADTNKTLSHLPAQLALLSSAYIRYYRDLYRSLQDYCWANLTDVNTKSISKTGEVLTPNVYINPNAVTVQGAKSLASLVSREHKLAELDINLTLWNGERHKVPSVAIDVGDVKSKFLSNRKFNDVASEMIDGSMESMEVARAHARAQSAVATVQALARLMQKPDASAATAMYDEFLVVSKVLVEQKLELHKHSFLKASTEAKQTYGSVSQKSHTYGTDFKTKDTASIVESNNIAIDAFNEAKQSVLGKYGQLFQDKNAVAMILADLFKSYSMPLMPVAMRYVYNAGSVFSLINEPAASAKGEAINFSIYRLTDAIFPQLSQIMNSPPFLDRYAANEVDYKSNAISSDKLSKLKEEALGDRNTTSLLTELLPLLGIDNAGIAAKHREMAAVYSGTTPEAMRKKRDAINKTISDVMGKFDELTEQGVTEGVSREHVIVYVCNKVLPGIIEEYVTEALSNRTGIKTSDQFEQLSDFVRTNFMSLKSGKKKGATFASNTVYGKINELYSAAEGARSISPLGAIMSGAANGFRAYKTAPALTSMQEMFNRNKQDPTVTDENWSDYANPRPRSWRELAHVTKAFADPIPDVSSKRSGIVRKLRLNVHPGQKLSKADIERINAEQARKKRGPMVVGTVEKTILNTVRRLGYTVSGNPVAAIRNAIAERRREILSVSKSYENDIIPYDINSGTAIDHSPFISDTGSPPNVEVDFSKSVSDLDVDANVVLDKSDEPQKIDAAVAELARRDLPENVLQKVRLELKRLPSQYLTDKKLPSTIDMILMKLEPTRKPTVRRITAPGSTEVAPVGAGYAAVLTISKTIFSSGQLAERLIPLPTDDSKTLNGKVEELMAYLKQLTEAMGKLRGEVSAASNDAVRFARLREILILAKTYNTQLLKAVNKARDLSERMFEASSESEFEYIKETLSDSRTKLKEFIAILSQMPFYKTKPDIVRRVTIALDSLVNVKDFAEAISPQKLQLLLMWLNKRAAANDEFANLLLEIDEFRVKETWLSQERSEETEEDRAKAIWQTFSKMQEEYQSEAERQQASQFATKERGPKGEG